MTLQAWVPTLFPWVDHDTGRSYLIEVVELEPGVQVVDGAYLETWERGQKLYVRDLDATRKAEMDATFRRSIAELLADN